MAIPPSTISRYSNKATPKKPSTNKKPEAKKPEAKPGEKPPKKDLPPAFKKPEIQQPPEVDKRKGKEKEEEKDKPQGVVTPYIQPQIAYTSPSPGAMVAGEGMLSPIVPLALPSFLGGTLEGYTPQEVGQQQQFTPSTEVLQSHEVNAPPAPTNAAPNVSGLVGLLPQKQPKAELQPKEQPKEQKPADPFATFSFLQRNLEPSLDVRAADNFADAVSNSIVSNQSPSELLRYADTSLDESFGYGVSDLNDLLKPTGYALGDMDYTRKAMRKLLDSTNPAERHSPSDLDDYTNAISSIRKDTTDPIRQINTPAERGNFVRQMQGSQDPMVQQMLGDAVQQTSPQALAFLIGDTQTTKDLPPALLKKQADDLWQSISSNIATAVDSQMEMLLQQDAGNYAKMQALQAAMQPDGSIDPQMFHQALMSSFGRLQSRLNAVQQIHDAVFRTRNQPITHRAPISKETIKSFRNS